MLIYNDFKEVDFWEMNYPKEYTYIMNNFIPSKELVSKLKEDDVEFFVSIKTDANLESNLTKAYIAGVKNIAIDAENYQNVLSYSLNFGMQVRILTMTRFNGKIALLPENLGGEKYKNYKKFICGLRPDIMIMERTYQQPEWYNILFYYILSYWTSLLFRTKVFIGVWYDDVEKNKGLKIADKHLKYAKNISFGKVFWYSETKSFPREQ